MAYNDINNSFTGPAVEADEGWASPIEERARYASAPNALQNMGQLVAQPLTPGGPPLLQLPAGGPHVVSPPDWDRPSKQ